jgi:hypothetical protein
MNKIFASATFLTIALSAPAIAQQPTQRLGEHPAVLAKRAYEKQGYDYASKFYPHPAWLYLETTAPESVADKSDSKVAQGWRELAERANAAATTAANITIARRP